jgi:CelD/BcsL family acetyltransferase involved in cellulose biosynthesis
VWNQFSIRGWNDNPAAWSLNGAFSALARRLPDWMPAAISRPMQLSISQTADDAVEREYETSLWEGDQHCPLFRQAWEALVSTRQTPAAFCQSPAFFDYLQDAEKGEWFEVLTMRRAGTARVGIVPIKISTMQLPLRFGPLRWSGSRLKSISILGSEPMIPADPAALDNLLLTLPARFPEVELVYLNEVSLESDLWRNIRMSAAIRRVYDVHVLDGFRECHTIILPKSIEEYYAKLGKKKRYNLLRQERILQDRVGALDLIPIEYFSDLSDMFDAVDKLSSSHSRYDIDRNQYISAAKHGFLKCFVLKSCGEPIAVALGIKAGNTYKIQRFFHDKQLQKYSPGTTLWQMILKDIIAKGEFKNIYMGYGSPTYRYRSTNIIENKGRVLLYRRSFANYCRIVAHSGYSAASGFVKCRIGRKVRY